MKRLELLEFFSELVIDYKRVKTIIKYEKNLSNNKLTLKNLIYIINKISSNKIGEEYNSEAINIT